MKNHRFILVAAGVTLAVLSLTFVAVGTRGEEPPANATLTLTSGYSGDAKMGGFDARMLRFALEQNGDGWKGTVMLDPNTLGFSKFGHPTWSTLMEGEQIDVALRLAGEEKGRKCYEVTLNGFDVTMYLVFPPRPNGIYRLIVAEEHGTRNVVFLEASDSEIYIARR